MASIPPPSGNDGEKDIERPSKSLGSKLKFYRRGKALENNTIEHAKPWAKFLPLKIEKPAFLKSGEGSSATSGGAPAFSHKTPGTAPIPEDRPLGSKWSARPTDFLGTAEMPAPDFQGAEHITGASGSTLSKRPLGAEPPAPEPGQESALLPALRDKWETYPTVKAWVDGVQAGTDSPLKALLEDFGKQFSTVQKLAVNASKDDPARFVAEVLATREAYAAEVDTLAAEMADNVLTNCMVLDLRAMTTQSAGLASLVTHFSAGNEAIRQRLKDYARDTLLGRRDAAPPAEQLAFQRGVEKRLTALATNAMAKKAAAYIQSPAQLPRPPASGPGAEHAHPVPDLLVLVSAEPQSRMAAFTAQIDARQDPAIRQLIDKVQAKDTDPQVLEGLLSWCDDDPAQFVSMLLLKTEQFQTVLTGIAQTVVTRMRVDLHEVPDDVQGRISEYRQAYGGGLEEVRDHSRMLVDRQLRHSSVVGDAGNASIETWRADLAERVARKLNSRLDNAVLNEVAQLGTAGSTSGTT